MRYADFLDTVYLYVKSYVLGQEQFILRFVHLLNISIWKA